MCCGQLPVAGPVGPYGRRVPGRAAVVLLCGRGLARVQNRSTEVRTAQESAIQEIVLVRWRMYRVTRKTVQVYKFVNFMQQTMSCRRLAGTPVVRPLFLDNS